MKHSRLDHRKRICSHRLHQSLDYKGNQKLEACKCGGVGIFHFSCQYTDMYKSCHCGLRGWSKNSAKGVDRCKMLHHFGLLACKTHFPYIVDTYCNNHQNQHHRKCNDAVLVPKFHHSESRTNISHDSHRRAMDELGSQIDSNTRE